MSAPLNTGLAASLARMLGGTGTGVLWSTAYLDEAQACDTTVLLSEGRVLHSGPPGDVVAMMAIGAGLTWGSAIVRW